MTGLLGWLDWPTSVRWATSLLVVGAVPVLLVATTAFLKISVVLALLRRALGVPEIPPTLVLTALALVLTLRAMAPVAGEVTAAVGELPESPAPAELVSAARRGAVPLGAFLARHADAAEVEAFADVARRQGEAAPAQDSWLVLLPAFSITELKEAFWIGFLLFLPFVVLELVIANVLLAAGLTGLSPTAVSLPFKLLLFVAIDGWSLLARGLVLGYV